MTARPSMDVYIVTPLITRRTVGLGKPAALHSTVTLEPYGAEMTSLLGKEVILGFSFRETTKGKVLFYRQVLSLLYNVVGIPFGWSVSNASLSYFRSIS